MLRKKLNEIVSGNYIFASVLHFFGISFFSYSDQTLEEVCANKGLDAQWVTKKLEEAVDSKNESAIASLPDYPIDLIIAYLIHSHHKFVKQRLPYLAELINSLELGNSESDQLVQDLKFVFPLFVRDYIEHIYEEEDVLFTYVLKLNTANYSRNFNRFELSQAISERFLQQHALEHTHEHGLDGIRKLTNNYLAHHNSLHLQVIFLEFQNLEKELLEHAKIENEIFFPKALALEQQVNKIITSNFSLN